MYTADIDEGEDPLEYGLVEVDGRTFYYRREKAPEHKAPRRRYSDQFKDPLFKTKDSHRKLKMLRQFSEKHDLDDLIDRYRSAVLECAAVLGRENSVGMPAIYSHFGLEGLGFDPEDFGVYREDE